MTNHLKNCERLCKDDIQLHTVFFSCLNALLSETVSTLVRVLALMKIYRPPGNRFDSAITRTAMLRDTSFERKQRMLTT